MRFWRTLRRALILFLLFLLVADALWQAIFVRATLVLLAEAPISEVRLTLDGEPAPPGIEHVEPSRMFVWPELPTGRYSRIELSWRRPDGEAATILQQFPQKYALRCVHVIRLDVAGNPLPPLEDVLPGEGSPWRWLSIRCERSSS